MAKNRMPLMASEKFVERMKNLQKRIRMKNGEEVSIRRLTDEIISNPLFNEIEKVLVDADKLETDIRVRFDGRYK